MRKGCSAGFTLMEIMLAVLIMGLVVSMVSFSLSGSIKAIDATGDQGDIYYRAQVAMERISQDLSSAVLSEQVEFIGIKNDNGDSRADELFFASMAHLVFDQEDGQTGMGIIKYAVRPDGEDEQRLFLLRGDVLYRPEEDGAAEQETEAFLLSDRLRSVRFSYTDHVGEQYEGWDTRTVDGDDEGKRRLPASVTCTLEYWLNQEEETTILFETTVILPVGWIQSASDESV